MVAIRGDKSGVLYPSKHFEVVRDRRAINDSIRLRVPVLVALQAVVVAGAVMIALLLAFAVGASKTPHMRRASPVRLGSAVVSYTVSKGDTPFSIAKRLAPQPALVPVIQSDISKVEGGAPLVPGTRLHISI